MTYYLGQAGTIFALPDPEVGLSMTPERIGAMHQLLSGAKVRDTIGYSNTWQLTWTAITRAQYGLLDWFYRGSGPYYFLDPEQVNQLPLNVSTGTDATKDTTGFSPEGTASLFSTTDGSANWNSIGGPFPANGTRTLQVTAPTSLTAGTVVAYAPQTAPVAAGATYTFSAYVSNTGVTTLQPRVQIRWLDATSTPIAAVDGNTIVAGTADRSIATGVAPTNATQAMCRLYTLTANTSGSTQILYTDGWQFELAGAATPWAIGTSTPKVTVDSLTRTTPITGICDAQMTLVQVG